jgi:uncharacterized protein (TIGR02099 family)
VAESRHWLIGCSIWIYRILTVIVLVAGFGFAATVLALRYWILPDIGSYREQLEHQAGRLVDRQVAIGGITADWRGLRPHLTLTRVVLFDAQGRRSLALPRIDATLSWLSLLDLAPRFYSIAVDDPHLSVRRAADGTIAVAGIEMNEGGEGDGRVGHWLLRQHQVSIRNATVSWHDQTRNTPPLILNHVDFRLVNGTWRHRFALRAQTASRLAGTLDVRGDFRGGPLQAPTAWRGRLYVKLPYADLNAWRNWIHYPIDVESGIGGLTLWLDFERGRMRQVTADVRLANVSTQLAPGLQPMNFTALRGRLDWQALPHGFEVSTSHLRFTATDGVTSSPMNADFRRTEAHDGVPAATSLRINTLDLKSITTVADRLPLDARVRQTLATLAPAGTLTNVSAQWSGPLAHPLRYNVSARFSDLALNRSGDAPGFSGVSGTLLADQQRGAVSVAARDATFDMPQLFRDPLAFDRFDARLSWTVHDGGAAVQLASADFANADFAGTASGTYQLRFGSKGTIDLTAQLARARAIGVPRYLPLSINGRARAWLDTAFKGGQSNDVRVRLKGNLDHWPFRDGDGGGDLFEVTADVTGGVLDFANRWPQISDISGHLTFRNQRMDVTVPSAKVLGMQIVDVGAQIPDLLSNDEMLHVDGHVKGATAGFLKFIQQSPVRDMIDRFADNAHATGNGTLALKMDLPLRRLKDVQLDGTYQFVNNQLTFGTVAPPLTKFNGRLQFTRDRVKMSNATGTLLGGPVKIDAATQADGTVHIALGGHADIDAVKWAAAQPLLQKLHGATDWRATIGVHKRLADVVVETDLAGIESDLPAPLAKDAASAIPLRFERTAVAADQDRISVSYGNVVAARIERAGKALAITRGTVSFGTPAPQPQRDGLWVSGTLPEFDLDRWFDILDQFPGSSEPAIAGIDIKIGALDAVQHRFTNLSLQATQQGGDWRAQLAGPELVGSVNWRSASGGKLTARMQKLTVPPANPKPAAAAASDNAKRSNYPAIDLIADDFMVKRRHLGRLQLEAVPQGSDWRIDKLLLDNPDGTLTINGVWHGNPAHPHTDVNVNLNVSDIGKFLTRLGYPGGVSHGTAKLSGPLSWNGFVEDLDYPSLSGQLTLHAANGQFVKMKPGIGKLLGILSLQALPRRLNLDFHDIFSEGLAFETIDGKMHIDHGVLSTDDFRMVSSAAQIAMTGKVNLAAETQDLNVAVYPSLSDSVTIAGALLGGPIAGVASFLLQKALRNPLGKLIAYHYQITGTWAQPEVSKVGRESYPLQEQSQ